MADSKQVPYFRYLPKPGFFLPLALAEQLQKKILADLEEEEAAYDARRNAAKKVKTVVEEPEKILLNGEEVGAPPAASTGPTLRLFDMQKVKKEAAGTSKGTDEREAKESLIQRLTDSTEYRRLGTIDPVLYREQLDQLERDFANFAEPVAYLRGVCALAESDNLTVRPDTMLLNGPPGIGKTEFCKQLAKIFGTTCKIAHLETMQTNADLVGSSVTWANSHEGLIFRQLALGQLGNPLVVLDELDKATGDDRFSVEKALYTLLTDNASTFEDASVPWLTLDASRMIYVATSNYSESINKPIMSRLHPFEIAAPTRDQSRVIVHNIFARLQQDMSGALLAMSLSEDAVEALLDHPPRQIMAAIKQAAGTAALKRKHIISADEVVAAEKAKASMGFY
jgi:ATP-dependent Lon protease